MHIFNPERLENIQTDLDLAVQGDVSATQRILQSHLPWLLHFGQFANDQLQEAEREVLAEPDEAENVNENVEEPMEDTPEVPEDTPEESSDSEEAEETTEADSEEVEETDAE